MKGPSLRSHSGLPDFFVSCYSLAIQIVPEAPCTPTLIQAAVRHLPANAGAG